MSDTQLATDSTSSVRAKRYARGAAMLRQWIVESDLEDESDYDWEAIEAEIQSAGMSCPESNDEPPTDS